MTEILFDNDKNIINHQFQHQNMSEAYAMLTNHQNFGEFSFHSDSFSDNRRNNNLRQDLMNLTKEQIIEILLEQINENKTFRLRTINSQQTPKHKSDENPCQNVNNHSLKLKNRTNNFDSQARREQYEDKYQQIISYMNEYISNTQQAQKHFFMVIDDLKNQNIKLKGQLIQTRNIQHRQKNIRSFGINIQDYLRINNQLSVKLQKVTIQRNALQIQCQTLKQNIDSNNKYDNSFEGAFNEIVINKDISGESDAILKDYSTVNNENVQNSLKKALKILQIQNKELRESLLKAQNMLAKKSQKIRNLLSQLQRLSQQKWIYKQEILDWKSKCMQYQSNSVKYHGKNVEETSVSYQKNNNKSIANN